VKQGKVPGSLSAWYVLRATRVHPPGHAASDPARAATFRAALQQAEELAAAARAVGPASRPLPLYYAVSQAGRAIVAARGAVPESPPYHGLALPTVADDILETVVEPAGDGQFPTVAEAAESEGLRVGAQIGAMLAAIPELAVWPELQDRWPVALTVWPRDAANRFDEIAAETLVPAAIGFSKIPDNRESIDAMLAPYPMVARPINQCIGIHMDHTPDGWGVVMYWPRSERVPDPLPPPYGGEGRRWLRPAVCGFDYPPSPLMTW